MQVTVRLNGTDTNPFERMGLRSNPFGQISKAEFAGADALLNDLHARPIKDEADLRERLVGCTQEFIDLCVNQFRPGEIARFTVEMPIP